MTQPPNNILAEQWVLGSMMCSTSALADVTEVLLAEDFYRPAHQIIYTVIVELYRGGSPVDMVTVFNALLNKGEHARTGGAPYLHGLVSSVDTPASAMHYARIVREQAVMRGLTETGTRVAAFGQAGAADNVADFVTRVQGDLKALLDRTAEEDWARIGEAVPETLDDIEASAARGKDGITGVPTGFADFDRLTHGLQPGQFIVVAGRPAMGKTTWATDVARYASIRQHIPGVIFSLEMDRKDLIKRILSAQARVPLDNVISGLLSDEEWTRLARALGTVADAPLYIDDTPNVTLASIHAKCRRLKETGGLGLVMVDYLQLMGSADKFESRQQEVSRISRGLKLLARELEVPLIGVCQLNRGPEQRADKRPQVSDLRESGAIEQDSDMVILLHREDAYDRESPRAGEADIILGKHRNGPTATIVVAFQGHYSRFVDMAPS